MRTISDKKSAASGFIIERTARRMKQVCQKMLYTGGYDITVDQWVILQELKKENGLNQFEIGQRTFKDAPTVTRIIDLLCEKDLTERLPDPEDRRRFRICLTNAGKRKVREVLPAMQEFRRKAHNGLSTDEVNQLIALLNKVFANLE